jgi:hypothetical protein
MVLREMGLSYQLQGVFVSRGVNHPLSAYLGTNGGTIGPFVCEYLVH